MIPDDLLPRDVFEIAGGANRNRRKSSLVELVGFDGSNKVTPLE